KESRTEGINFTSLVRRTPTSDCNRRRGPEPGDTHTGIALLDDIESVADAREAQREHEAKVAKHVEARASRRHHDDDDEAAPGTLGFMTKGQAKHLVEQQKRGGA
ncbi:hypothetical protein LTR16_011287, partial [Cryomyces antarcticus]